jgi:hypothetical protein
MEKKFFHKKMDDEAHVVKEWDSDESSFNEDIATIAINKGILFPNIDHKCLMAKEGKKKVTWNSSEMIFQKRRITLLV